MKLPARSLFIGLVYLGMSLNAFGVGPYEPNHRGPGPREGIMNTSEPRRRTPEEIELGRHLMREVPDPNDRAYPPGHEEAHLRLIRERRLAEEAAIKAKQDAINAQQAAKEQKAARKRFNRSGHSLGIGPNTVVPPVVHRRRH